MVAWVVIDRRHLPRTPRGPRQSPKSRLPRALGAKGPTPGLHLSGVQIEAQPQLWDADSDLVGVLTPVLPLTNHSPLTCSNLSESLPTFRLSPLPATLTDLPQVLQTKDLRLT